MGSSYSTLDLIQQNIDKYKTIINIQDKDNFVLSLSDDERQLIGSFLWEKKLELQGKWYSHNINEWVKLEVLEQELLLRLQILCSKDNN